MQADRNFHLHDAPPQKCDHAPSHIRVATPNCASVANGTPLTLSQMIALAEEAWQGGAL
jgi:hypothetical protein